MAKKARDLDDLRTLAAAVQGAEQALDGARRERDEGIRDIRRAGQHTVSEIAEAAGVSEPTVRAVVRGVRPGT
ncbi:hypothetical protein I6A60_31220 [Frankia sp. AgB1.9]|uniref:hypothetical protein n=1 Tax=unclassified Frankia TaxID=2632575 RepID=UPI0019312EA3|nr:MULTISPECIES: hypothetical protein [unclassified Frankia]MBL7493020.1 hypothetical protein [Frankia sp. AgW1.1]MBL7552301.1 hypothetical protein [Frankia sp. AgB1.9]MBL7622054.1 hypothetical protein [Frankia sp. AgB1.8]